jgi:hypothetical protein
VWGGGGSGSSFQEGSVGAIQWQSNGGNDAACLGGHMCTCAACSESTEGRWQPENQDRGCVTNLGRISGTLGG